MPRYDVIMLPLAENDIIRNVDYIFFDKQTPETALKLLKGFRRTIDKLRFMPEQHEYDEDRELAARGIRKCYFKSYKIFFYVNKEKCEIYILRVLHMLVDAKPLCAKF